MANEESNKFSSNLKVPPLKIVLSSHQNNAVVNISNSIGDEQFKSSEKDDNSNDHIDHKELGRGNNLDNIDGSEKHNKKNSKSSPEGNESESGQPSNRTAGFSSSSSSSSSSDRSTSTTPSSESESLASNSTIISEHHQQQQQVKNKTDHKDDVSVNKQDRISRYGIKVERSTNNSSSTSTKRSHDISVEQASDSTTTSSKEQILNANQRITRSSQRAAQQSKTENPGEQNGEESINISENQDKTHDSARKAKRRKGEPQENEQEGTQTIEQPPVIMADIDPADYQLPSQNSFELYRDISKRPYKKLMNLNHIQPRVPHGFKDYLLNGGPYLLDGNKLGVGLNGARLESLNNGDQAKNGINSTSRIPLRMKLSKYHQKLSAHQPSHQRHTSYTIPKLLEAPKNLQLGSPLYELFQDQEKARHQMRMQHLKERERSILAAEQEILRAYNKAAIADVRQTLHLSACTYFYYQERYHYLDEKSSSNGNVNNSNEEIFSKEIFLNQLQEIDDKWDKIKKDMLVRHKNEADSLHAVQSLEWEWKAKEIGACDVRVSLKIEPEFVPRVEVAALDY